MTKSKTLKLADNSTAGPVPGGVQSELQGLLGPPPLIAGEDPAAYEALTERVSQAVQPSDIIEHIWVRDVVDLIWEIARLRRIKTDLMTNAAAGIIKDRFHFSRVLGGDDARVGWLNQNANALKTIAQVMGPDAKDGKLIALGFESRITLFERLDSMIMKAEARRNAIFREMDRRRETAQRMRQISKVIDAEFEEVHTGDKQ